MLISCFVIFCIVFSTITLSSSCPTRLRARDLHVDVLLQQKRRHSSIFATLFFVIAPIAFDFIAEMPMFRLRASGMISVMKLR